MLFFWSFFAVLERKEKAPTARDVLGEVVWFLFCLYHDGLMCKLLESGPIGERGGEGAGSASFSIDHFIFLCS